MRFYFVPIIQYLNSLHPSDNYIVKVNNRNTRARCEICSKLTIKTPELVLVFLLLTFGRCTPTGFIIDV